MIGFGTLVILGVVIGSVSVSMFWFIDNLTVDVTSESVSYTHLRAHET